MARKIFLIVSIVVLILAVILSGCGKVQKNPFSLDYKIDQSNVKYYTEGDTAAMLMTASPFYAGAQPFPGLKTGEYDAARRAKVEEIISEADKVVKTTAKIKGKVDKLRTAYLDYLTVCSKEDKRLQGFTEATVKQIIFLKSKEVIAEATYESIVTDSDKPFAKSFMEYAKVAKGVEVGGLYMKDLNNIVGYSALALEALKDSKNPKIRKANSRLDKEMAKINSIKGDLKAIATSMNNIEYGFKQIETGDYYMAKAALAFMDSKMPELKAKIKAVKPGKGFDAKDIGFTKSYLGEIEQANNKLRKVLGAVDESKLVKVSLASDDAIISPAWADAKIADDTFRLAYGSVNSPAKAGEGLTFTGLLSGGWNAAKLAVQTTQKLVGGALDLTGAVTKSVIDVPMGLYYGNSCGAIGERMGSNFQQVAQNVFAGTSGSSYLREAKSYAEGADTTAGSAASGTASYIMGGEGWTSWAAGGIAKATSSVFTDMAKGIYAVADPTSSMGELAVGAMNIGFSFVGGSKVLMKGSQVPGVLKGAKEGTGILAEKGCNFLSRWGANSELMEMNTLIKEGWKNCNSPKAMVQQMQLLTQAMAKGAVIESLEQTSKQLNQKMAQFIASSASAGAGASTATMRASLNEFVQKQFQANMVGYTQAIKTALGESAVGYFDTVVGQMADDALKQMVEKAIDKNLCDGSYSGTLSGPGTSGSIRFIIKGNSVVNGSVSGIRDSAPYHSSFSGTFAPAGGGGSIRCSASGQQKYDGEWYSFSGFVNGHARDGSASGTWGASNVSQSGQGSWSASRK